MSANQRRITVEKSLAELLEELITDKVFSYTDKETGTEMNPSLSQLVHHLVWERLEQMSDDGDTSCGDEECGCNCCDGCKTTVTKTDDKLLN